MYLCLAGLICKTNPLHFFASSICDFTVNWLIHAMFLWGIDYLHFHSDKPKCIGAWDGTCPKASRDYKAENRTDQGPSFALSRWVPFSHGNTASHAPQATNHHAAPSAPHHCPKTSAGICGCAQSVKCGAALVPLMWALRYKPGHCSCTDATAPIMRLGLFLAVPAQYPHSSRGHIDRADALEINVCNSPGYCSWGDQSSILHSQGWNSSLWKLWVAFTCYMLCITPVRTQRRQASAAFGSINSRQAPHARDSFLD